MEVYPGLKSQNKNPLKLYKKIWYLSECKKFLENQQLSKTHTLRDITNDLWNYQKRRLGMSCKKCGDMVKQHFEKDKCKEKNTDSSSEESDVEEGQIDDNSCDDKSEVLFFNV